MPIFGCNTQDGATRRLSECFMYIVLFHLCHGGSYRHTFVMAMRCKLELNIAFTQCVVLSKHNILYIYTYICMLSLVHLCFFPLLKVILHGDTEILNEG